MLSTVLALLIGQATPQKPIPQVLPAVPRPDPQMGAMIGIYDMLCLRVFPDEAKIEAAMTKIGATPLTPDEMKIYLRDDPGRGWRIVRDGHVIYTVTIEAAPIRACAIRSMTSNGLLDEPRYAATVAAAETNAGGGFVKFPPFDHAVGDIRTQATGAQRQNADGSAEAFYLIRSTPVKMTPTTAIEVRMVHQLMPPRSR